MDNHSKESRKKMFVIQAVMFLLLGFLLSPAYSASKVLLVLGDSLSAEYGLARGTGWVALLDKKMQAEKHHTTIINASISGETVSGGKARLPQLLEKYHPDIVLIELGANDGLRGLSLSAMEKDLRTMIEVSKKAKAKVLLIGLQIPPNYGVDYTQKFSTVYTRLAKEQAISLVPFLLEGIADQPNLFQADRLHPTAEAQPQLLVNVWQHLRTIFK